MHEDRKISLMSERKRIEVEMLDLGYGIKPLKINEALKKLEEEILVRAKEDGNTPER